MWKIQRLWIYPPGRLSVNALFSRKVCYTWVRRLLLPVDLHGSAHSSIDPSLYLVKAIGAYLHRMLKLFRLQHLRMSEVESFWLLTVKSPRIGPYEDQLSCGLDSHAGAASHCVCNPSLLAVCSNFDLDTSDVCVTRFYFGYSVSFYFNLLILFSFLTPL